MARRVRLYFSIAIALVSLAVVFAINHSGIGISADSIDYSNSAHYLAQVGEYLRHDYHTGLPTLQTQFPPAYPFLLSLGIRANLTVAATGILLNALSHAILTVLIFNTLLWQTRNVPIALFATLWLFHPRFLLVYQWLWSEPIFIVFLVCGLALLFHHFEAGETRPHQLLMSAILFAFASLTRYAMIPFLLIGVGYVLIKHRTRLHALVYTAITLCPLGAWLLLTTLSTNALANRTLTPLAIPSDRLLSAIETFKSWALLSALSAEQFVAIVALIAVVVYFASRRTKLKRAQFKLAGYLFALCLVYMFFLMLAITFLDPIIPLSERILSPIFPLIVMSLAVIIKGITDHYRIVPIAILIYTICLLNYSLNWISIESHGELRRGYTATHWAQSTFVNNLRQIPADAIMYTNVPKFTDWYTENTVRAIPTDSLAIQSMIDDIDSGAYLAFHSDWSEFPVPDLVDLPSIPPSQSVTN